MAKDPFAVWAMSLLRKIGPSPNMNQSPSLERSYKELLNALISFEIRCS